MKHTDIKKQLEQNSEYQQAKAELELTFAFGDAVLHARLKKGWTQTELAKRVGTRQANISRIEAGLANPTLELIQKVCRVLDLKPDFQEMEKPSQECVNIWSIFTRNWNVSFKPRSSYEWPMKSECDWSFKASTTCTKKEVVRQ